MKNKEVSLTKTIGRYILALNSVTGVSESAKPILAKMLIDNITKRIDTLKNNYSPDTVVAISFKMKFQPFYQKEELLTKTMNILADWKGGDLYTFKENVVRSSSSYWRCGQTIDEFKCSVDWLIKNIDMFKEQETDKFDIIFSIQILGEEKFEKIEKSYIEINF